MPQPDGRGISRSAAGKLFAPILDTPLSSLVQGLGLESNLPYEESGPPLGTNEDTGQSQTGWGSPVGIRGPFNAIAVRIASVDASFPVSGIRLWVNDGDYDGEELADVSQPLNIPFGNSAGTEVIIPLGRTIDRDDDLYVRHNCNGKVGVFRTNPSAMYPVTSGYPQYGSTNNTSLTAETFAKPGATTQKCNYYRFLNTADVEATVNGIPTQSIISQTEAATFTGYSSYVGSPTHRWGSVDIGIAWFRVGGRANNVRVVARRTNASGEILGDVTLPISWVGVAQNRPQVLRVNFGGLIDPGAVWLEIIGDGYMTVSGLANGTFASGTYGQTRYATTTNLLNPTWQNSGTQWNPWVRFVRVDGSNGGPINAKQVTTALSEQVVRQQGPRFVKLANYFAVSGIEFSLYFDNLIVSPDGRWAPDAYDFDVTCSIGHQQKERFVILAGDAPSAGTYPITINVYDRGVLCDTLTADIVVCAATAGGGASRKLLPIGDSLTEQGHIYAEIVKYSVDDANLDVALNGNYTATNIKSSDGTNRTFNHAGNSGKTWTWWYSDASSPMVFSGSFNFASYLSTNGITLASGDTVAIMLGINDVINATTDAAVYTACGLVKTAADAMITSIRAAVSGIRIVILVPTLPVYSQDAAGDDYGNGIVRFRARRNMQLLREWMASTYDTTAQRTNSVFVADAGAVWDNVNNVRLAASAAWNSRATLTTQRANDLVHPGGYGTNENGGAFQISDAVWAFLKNKA